MAKKIYSKQIILQTAFELCKVIGVDALSMRMLARELGCSVMPIYDSFESKEDLVQSLSSFCFAETMEELESNTIFERYAKMTEYGLRYPKFFLDFVHIKHKKSEQDQIINKLYKLMRIDPRLGDKTDEEIQKINSQIELFIVGIIFVYVKRNITEELIEQVKKFVVDTSTKMVDGLI